MMGGKCMKLKNNSNSDLHKKRVSRDPNNCTLLSVQQYDQVSKKADFDSGFEFDKDIQSHSSLRGSVSARIRNKSDSVSKKPDLDSGFEDISSYSSLRGSLSARIRNTLPRNPFQKKSKKSRSYDFDSGIQLHESLGKEDSTSTKHIPGAGAYKKRRVQRKKKKITFCLMKTTYRATNTTDLYYNCLSKVYLQIQYSMTLILEIVLSSSEENLMRKVNYKCLGMQ